MFCSNENFGDFAFNLVILKTFQNFVSNISVRGGGGGLFAGKSTNLNQMTNFCNNIKCRSV